MAAIEIYDKVATATPDYDYTLTLRAQGKIVEEWVRNQVVHRADDGTVEVITLAAAKFFVNLNFHYFSASDMGILVDLYYDNAKAKGRARTFKWAAYDGHTYVVRFDCDLNRIMYKTDLMGANALRFEIMGKV